MKTKEFIKRVEELGFKVFNNNFWTQVEKSNGKLVITNISEEYSSVLDTNYPGMKDFNPTTRKELLELIVEYANTPLEERKDTKYCYKIGDDLLIGYTSCGSKEYHYELSASDVALKSKNDKLSFTDEEFKKFPFWTKQLYYRGHLVKEEVE